MLDCLKKAGLALALLCAIPATRPAHALPPGFAETPIGGSWNEVSGLAFSTDGTRLYVVERGGRVWIVENGVKLETPLLDISDAVGAWRDYGMLGFALHPNFELNGYFYVWYVVDRYYLYNHGTPGYNPALLESQQFEATIGRLSRFTADPATNRQTVLPGSEVMLIGATPQDGLPILHESHGTGQLVFGQDGTLLVSGGDGASYALADTGSLVGTWYAQALAEGIIPPEQNVGAWRAQQVDSLNGKILRIDPYTGEGIPSNPWYDPTAPSSPRSRAFAVGLRNPYRFTLRPGTGSHDPADGDPGTFYIGDVGWNFSEDMQILTQAGQNFGWPAFEGPNHLGIFGDSDYWSANTPNPYTKNPLASEPGCTVPFLRFKDLIDQASQNPSDPPTWPNPCNPAVQIPDSWVDPSDSKLYRYEKFVHSRPPISWRISAAVATWDAFGNPTIETMGESGSPVAGANFGGATSTAGVWYTGTDFPEEWRNTYFHGDFTAGWIKSFGFDENDVLHDVVDFVEEGSSVTFITTNPVSGRLYYVNWGDTVSEVRWVGTGNTPPTAVIEPAVSWSAGNSLNVQFTGSGSSDPDPGAVLSYAWDFGDGGNSTSPDPQHLFTTGSGAPVSFTVTLTVTDEDTNSDGATANVHLNNSPPSVELTSPVDAGLYSMLGPTNVSVASSVSDAQSPTPSLACSLMVELVHNSHTHQEPLIPSCSASVPITPVGCDGNSYSWRFTLTVTDPQGLASTDVATLFPDCSTLPNEPPDANADVVPVPSGGAVEIDVLANDTDSDGAIDPTTVAIATPPTSGTADVNPVTGVITYEHDGTGSSDSFTYTVEDDDGDPSTPAIVSVVVLGAPTGLVAAYAFDEPSGSIAVDVSGNGNDGTLTGATRTTEGHAGGALSFDGVDDLVLVPDASSLDLTTGMTLEAWVYPTSAMSGWKAILNKQADSYFLVANTPSDHPGVGGHIFGGSCCALLEAAGAALAPNAWTHLAGTYDGTNLRLYRNGVLVGTKVQPSALTPSGSPLRIGASADAGEFFPGRIDDVRIYDRPLNGTEIQGDMLMAVNGTPTALADSTGLAEGGSTGIPVASNDLDPENALDLDSIEIVTPPAHGLAVPGAGSVAYTHDGGETTSDSFTYTIRDAVGWLSNVATVSVTVTPVNDAPVAAADAETVAEGGSAPIAVAANDSDAEGALDLGSIEIVTPPAHGIALPGSGSVAYTHDGGETTSDSFTYTIRDAANAPSNAATVTLTVTPVNDPPVAAADAGTVAEGGSTPIAVAANDTDAEGALDLGSIQIVTPPAHGIALPGSGSVAYTHDGSETTSDSFTYTIRDAANAPSNAATVTVTVTADNDPPVAAPDSAEVLQGGSVPIALTANDSDPEGLLDLESVEIVDEPANGSVEIDGGGQVTYAHDGGSSESDSFTYRVRDTAGLPSSATSVSISVTAAPEVPALPAAAWLAIAAGLLAAGRAGLRSRLRS
jgi:glucose/arabinose dehydrogenase